MIIQSLPDVYDEYNNAVLHYISIIETYYGVEIAHGRREKLIPQKGCIGSIEFSFHGIGCRVIDGVLWVDWDFPIIEKKVGLDPWKLWGFTRDIPEKFGKFSSLEFLRDEIKLFEQKGLLGRGTGSNQYIVLW
jgi:hypothetical protein